MNLTKKEIKDLFTHLTASYKNYKFDSELTKYWEEQLSQYDYEDINDRLRELMSEDRYAYQPPLLEALTRGLTKKSNKVDLSDYRYPCMFCRRLFDSIDEVHKHEDRCRSIKYLERQCERFNLQTLDKRKFYEMDEDEFEERYNKFLRYFQQQTTNEAEKQIIEYAFNAPNREQANTVLHNS